MALLGRVRSESAPARPFSTAPPASAGSASAFHDRDRASFVILPVVKDR